MNKEIFKRNVRNLKAIQETRIKIGNGIYAMIVEEAIKNSTFHPQIVQLRRDKTADRKDTAKLIKKALKEVGKEKEELDKEFKLQKKGDTYYKPLKVIERTAEKMLRKDLIQMQLYTKFLSKVKGLGVLTSAQLLAIVGDMTRFGTPSSLWHYFGVHVVDGEAARLKRGVEASWNPKAKALLLGVIGENFIRQRSQYRVIYDERSAKTKRTKPIIWNLNLDGTKRKGKNMHPKHGFRDAIRVMMKRFLCEFWKAGYLAKGIRPPRNPYIIDDPKHHLDPDIVKFG